MTVHSTTNVSPAELLFGRSIKSKLDLVKPDTALHVQLKQHQQKSSHDAHASNRKFSVGEKVYYRNFNQGPKWLAGVIAKCSGPVSFVIKSPDGLLIRRHVDQVKKRYAGNESDTEPSSSHDSSSDLPPSQNLTGNACVRSSYPSRDRRPPDRFAPVVH